MTADFLYFFTDSMGRYLFMDGDNMNTSPDPKPLQFTPDGGRETSLQNQRNQQYWGLDRTFSIPLNFVGDGALILKTIFYTRGTEFVINFAIAEQKLFDDGSQYGYYYAPFYSSQVDLSTFKHDGAKVSVSMMEKGFPAMLKDNAATTYEYKLSESTNPKILHNGIKLYEKGNLTLLDSINIENGIFNNFTAPMVLGTTEGQSAGITFGSQTLEAIPNAAYYATSQNCFARAAVENTGPVTVFLDGMFKTVWTNYPVGVLTNLFMKLIIKHVDNTFSQVTIPHTVFSGTGSSTGTVLLWDFTGMSVDLAPGEMLFMVGTINTGTGVAASIQFLPDGKLTASFTNTYRTSQIDYFTFSEVFAKLIGSITKHTFTTSISSDIVKPGFKIAITSGDGIRSLSTATLKLTFNNLWSFINAEWDAAMYVVEKVVYLELKEKSIDFDTYIDLGEVSKLVPSPATDYLFNRIKAGYPNQDYGETNGKDEFNTTAEWKAPISTITTEKDFISDIRTDSFGIEFIRSNLDGKTTTDDIGDGTPFAMHIEDAPFDFDITLPIFGTVIHLGTFVKLNRDLNQYATGILSPETVFNLIFSPKQCLLRHGNYLASCLNWHESEKLTFQTSDKNQLLAVNDPAGAIIENADVPISTLGTKYFLPVLFDMTSRVSNSIIPLLKANPKYTIRFTWEGIQYKGIPIKIGVQPSTQAAQQVQVLCSADNDLLPLINSTGDQ